MICQKCNATIPDKAVFCPVCGGRVETPVTKKPDPEDQTVRVRKVKPETEISVKEQDPVTQGGNSAEDLWQEDSVTIKEKTRYGINFISLALLVVCFVLWALVPFMAVNLETLSDQPTALALLLDNVDYTGSLTDALAYWIAIAAVAGLVLCLACVVLKSRVVTRVLAVLTAGSFVISIVNVAKWAVDIREFFEFFGIAFWGILVLMAAVAVLGGGWRKKK